MGLEIVAAELDRLAVGDLGITAADLAALDVDGWVVVPSVLGDAEVRALRDEFERLVASDPGARTQELGTRRAHATRENEAFAVCWRHRVLLEAAAHVLGERFEVGGVDLRDPLPDGGVQKHHPDHGVDPVPGITATWFLDAFTEANGATIVAPGTHRTGAPVGANTRYSLPGQVVATGPAGSVLLRDCRLFHAAGRNRTSGTRRAAHVFLQHVIPDGT